jgi:hypothetical protein
MHEREKELKAFNQCADALVALDKKSVLKVFHLLSVHFEVMPTNPTEIQRNDEALKNDTTRHLAASAVEAPAANGGGVLEPAKAKKAPKVRSVSSDDPKFLTDLDLRPPEKESLKEFVAKYNAKSYFERNLVYTQYFHEIVGMSTVTVDHIYTCYRHMGGKIPAFPFTIKDTRHHKGWLEFTDMNSIKVTRTGLNDLLDLLNVKPHEQA